MTNYASDAFTDPDGTELRSDSGTRCWFSPNDPGNMFIEVNGGRGTGSTSQHISPSNSYDARYITASISPEEYDITLVFVPQTLLSSRNEIGLDFWHDGHDAFVEAWYSTLTGLWRLDKSDLSDGVYDPSYDEIEPVRTALDSHAMTLTAGHSYTLTARPRTTGVTVTLDGATILSTSDVSGSPGPGGYSGVYLWGGTATTGLQMASFTVDDPATGGGDGGGGGGGGGGGTPPPRRRRVCGC